MSLSKIVIYFGKVFKWSKIFFFRYLDYFFNYSDPRKNFRYKHDPSILHLGWCAIYKQVFIKGRPFVKKVFVNNSHGLSSFRNEKRAHKLYNNYNLKFTNINIFKTQVMYASQSYLS